MTRIERIRGCLLGGAVGDALGAPVEFLDWLAIRAQFGTDGIIEFVPAYGRLGAVTDDSQMMLFTAEGLLRAYTPPQSSPNPIFSDTALPIRLVSVGISFP